MSLAAVRDLREARAPAGPDELVAFETDVLAGVRAGVRHPGQHQARRSRRHLRRRELAPVQGKQPPRSPAALTRPREAAAVVTNTARVPGTSGRACR